MMTTASVEPVTTVTEVNRNHHSLFAWIQLIATLSVPILIAIYTVVQNHSEINIANQNRLKDQEIAEGNRAKDEKLADDQRKENILVEYQNFLAKLLIDHGMTLNKSDSAPFVVRVKTMTAVKQLDPARKVFLIQSLFEANLITTTLTLEPVLLLESADLSNLDLGSKDDNAERPHHPCLSLYGAILSNSSFRRSNINGANFSRAFLRYGDLTDTFMQMESSCSNKRGVWSIDFTDAILEEATFEKAFLLEGIFSYAKMFKTNLQNFDCHRCSMIGTNMTQADLTRATFLGPANMMFSKFIDAILINSRFRNYVSFPQANFTQANARGIEISQCMFFSAHFQNGFFNQATITTSDFTSAWMDGANVTEATITNTIFDFAKLLNVDFSYTTCNLCTFVGATLKGSNLRGASFTMSNFTYAVISDEQLAQCTSLAGSTLPNGTIVPNKIRFPTN